VWGGRLRTAPWSSGGSSGGGDSGTTRVARRAAASSSSRCRSSVIRSSRASRMSGTRFSKRASGDRGREPRSVGAQVVQGSVLILCKHLKSQREAVWVERTGERRSEGVCGLHGLLLRLLLLCPLQLLLRPPNALRVEQRCIQRALTGSAVHATPQPLKPVEKQHLQVRAEATVRCGRRRGEEEELLECFWMEHVRCLTCILLRRQSRRGCSSVRPPCRVTPPARMVELVRT
jgi:hypothetical protein